MAAWSTPRASCWWMPGGASAVSTFPPTTICSPTWRKTPAGSKRRDDAPAHPERRPERALGRAAGNRLRPDPAGPQTRPPAGHAGSVCLFGSFSGVLPRVPLPGPNRALPGHGRDPHRVPCHPWHPYIAGRRGAAARDRDAFTRPAWPLRPAPAPGPLDAADLAVCERYGCGGVLDAVPDVIP